MRSRRSRAGMQSRHSGGIGAPPGTTKSPCQELADSQARPFDVPLESAARHCLDAAHGAPSGARAFREERETDMALRCMARHDPSLAQAARGDEQSPGVLASR